MGPSDQHATGVAPMTTANTHIEQEQKAENTNRLMQMLLIAAIAASGLSMVFSIGTAVASASEQPAASVAADH